MQVCAVLLDGRRCSEVGTVGQRPGVCAGLRAQDGSDPPAAAASAGRLNSLGGGRRAEDRRSAEIEIEHGWSAKVLFYPLNLF